MKKIIVLFLLPLLMVVACKKDITSINVDPKNPQQSPASGFFTSAQKSLVDLLANTNVNSNIFRLVVQYWQESTYTDESNYDIDTREIPRQVWNTLYRDVMRDIRETKALVPAQVLNADIRENQLAIAEILEIYSWYYLVTTFGDIPYSEALDQSKAQPVYDNQQTIFNDLLTRIDAAIAELNTAAESFGGADLLYGGDVASWKLFANSFKLKMGMTIADADNAKAKAAVESAVASGVFTSDADNASFQYLSSPPNTNPVWDDLVQSGRKDFVAASTIVDAVEGLNDPRLDDYFTLDASSGYSGGTPGAPSTYAIYSKPDEVFEIPDQPHILLSYSEVEFFLAEAVERGYSVGGTAMSHYNNAVTASIVFWGGTAGEATAYLAQPSVNYLTAPGTYKQKIGSQKWIALYNQAWEEWIEWRRLNAPAIVAPPTAVSVTPRRYTYPVLEQNLNNANWTAASTAIGGDDVGTKLFWDKN